MSQTIDNPGNAAGIIGKTNLQSIGVVFAEPHTIANLPKTPIALAPHRRARRVASSQESIQAGPTRDRPETTIPFRDSSFFQLTGEMQ
jgi:hypothetical protein